MFCELGPLPSGILVALNRYNVTNATPGILCNNSTQQLSWWSRSSSPDVLLLSGLVWSVAWEVSFRFPEMELLSTIASGERWETVGWSWWVELPSVGGRSGPGRRCPVPKLRGAFKTDFWRYLGFCPNQGGGGLTQSQVVIKIRKNELCLFKWPEIWWNT